MVSREARRAFDLQADPNRMHNGIWPAHAGPILPDGPPSDRSRRPLRHHRSQQLGHTRQQLLDPLRRELLPYLDSGLTTLLHNLADRGRLGNTLVVVTGEFGRTPQINNNAGRDHWGPAFTVAIAGGGIHGGRVVGSSDARAERPASNPHSPEDLAATIFHLMGIDAAEELPTHLKAGRSRSSTMAG